MINIQQALQHAILLLGTDNRMDGEILLAFTLGQTRTYLYTHPEQLLSSAEQDTFAELLAERKQGRPVAYLTGMREFWSLPLKVSPDTLIPRHETELLVELALQLLPEQFPLNILDLGTGSGAIALALAKERPQWQIFACDRSEAALAIAKENAARLRLDRIHFFLSDWFTAIIEPPCFHAIISNPPYLASNDAHLHQGDVRFEPRDALVSSQDGLAALGQIIKQSVVRLEPGGLLLLEHGYEQKGAVQAMLRDYGYEALQSWQDWQGNDRVSGGKKSIGIPKFLQKATGQK